MDRSEGDDDELYPTAPVPAHERGWRHPSEIGQAAWLRSEPPLVIGKGLSVATGIVGVGLALLLLWAVVPTRAGGGVRVADLADPGASTSLRAPTPLTTTTADTVATLAVTTTAQPTTTTAPAGSRTTTTATTVAELAPKATYQIEQLSPRVPNAVAVALDGGSLVLTTSNAIDQHGTVRLLMSDGHTVTASVVRVDTSHGLALLAADVHGTESALRVAAGIRKGDVLTFYGTREATVVAEGDGAQFDWPDIAAREGTPVLNQRGELVGLCTRTATGMRLITLSDIEAVRSAIAADALRNTVWLGVHLDMASSDLIVAQVIEGSPAWKAGLEAGDTILGVDGVDTDDRTTLVALLQARKPGDTVALRVADDAGAIRTVDLVLGDRTDS